jgi:hypothetical protein
MLLLLLAATLSAAPDDLTKHLLLDDSRFIMRLNPAAIEKSPALDDAARKKLHATFGREMFKMLLKQLGLTEQIAVDSATVSFRGLPVLVPGEADDPDEIPCVFVIEGDFRKENLGEKMAEKIKTGEITEIKVLDLPVYFPHRQRDAMFLSQIGERTMMFAQKRTSIEEAVKGVSDLKAPRESMRGLFEKSEGVPPLLDMAMEINDAERRQIAAMESTKRAPFAAKLAEAHLRIRLEEKETIVARAVFTDTLSAAQADALLKTWLMLGRAAVAQATDEEKKATALRAMDAFKVELKEKTLTLRADLERTLLNSTFAEFGMVSEVRSEPDAAKPGEKKPDEAKPEPKKPAAKVSITIGGPQPAEKKKD